MKVRLIFLWVDIRIYKEISFRPTMFAQVLKGTKSLFEEKSQW